jgi:hypothetical protein
MSKCEEWLGRIIDAAQDIASREYQQEAWFTGGRFVSSPDEVYQILIVDQSFDNFFKEYGHSFAEEQTRSAKELRNTLERYYDGMPTKPNPLHVLNDPEWDLVRQAARFVLHFKAKHDENSALRSADRQSRD